MRKRIAVLASGSGSNFKAIIDTMNSFGVYEVVLCISDKAGAYVLQRASTSGIAAFSFIPKSYETKAAYEQEIINHLQQWNVDYIVLAGYMRLIGSALLEKFEGRIINIHPSLLPSFPGLNAVRQALEAGVKVTGMTIHYVDAGMDT
ncbi:MAG: phosphoribosylglycinamide formyltransferase, partial [Bacilli bacterium]